MIQKLYKNIIQRLRSLRYQKQLSRRRNFLRQEVKKGLITIDIHVPGMGLFAHLAWVLHGLIWAERKGYELNFICTNDIYNDADQEGDWLAEVIEQSSPISDSIYRIGNYEELPCYGELPTFDRKQAMKIVARHLSLTPSLATQVENKTSEWFSGRFVIALHYRGSDKANDATLLSYEHVISTLKRAVSLVAKTTRPVVFVATDEESFLEQIRAEIIDADFHAFDGNIRSEAKQGSHLMSRPDGRRLAREAMLDTLLLSQSAILFKTASALSGWAALLGKEMPIVMLSQHHKSYLYCPENILAAEAYMMRQTDEAILHALSNWRTTPQGK